MVALDSELYSDSKTIDGPEQIRICLNCPKPSCPFGECEIVNNRNSTSRTRYALIPYKGEKHSLKKWGIILGISTDALARRLKMTGNDMEAALKIPLRHTAPPQQYYTAFGQRLSLRQWSALCNKTCDALRMRLKVKPPEEAFKEAKGLFEHKEEQ